MALFLAQLLLCPAIGKLVLSSSAPLCNFSDFLNPFQLKCQNKLVALGLRKSTGSPRASVCSFIK